MKLPLSSHPLPDQVAAIMTASPEAIRSAQNKLRRRAGGGKPRSNAPRCPQCGQDTLATIRARGKCRGCGYKHEKPPTP